MPQLLPTANTTSTIQHITTNVVTTPHSHLVHHPLVDQVCQELGGCDGDRLVVALVRALELRDDAVAQQLPKLGELCVDDADQRSVQRAEGGAGQLSLHDRLQYKGEQDAVGIEMRIENGVCDLEVSGVLLHAAG
jgi:hypothetical protein